MLCDECPRDARYWVHHKRSKAPSAFLCHSHMLRRGADWFRAPITAPSGGIDWSRWEEAHDRESWRDYGSEPPLAP